MPVARYFLYVGGALLVLLFVIDAMVPRRAGGRERWCARDRAAGRAD